MSERVYKCAVVGDGLSARVFMIPFLHGTRLNFYALVRRRDPTTSETVQSGDFFTRPKVYVSSDEMLEDEAMDVVIVATPPTTHFDLCKAALEAGKHVVCEKPFTMTSNEAIELIALSKRKNLLLTVFHNRRWDADFVTLSSLIKDNHLGCIVEFESHFDWHAPLPQPGWESTWRTQFGTGSAVLYDLGSHLIDQALQLFGMPQAVTAFLYHQRENAARWGDADSMTVVLGYEGGPFVTLKASVMNPEKEQLRFWIRGTKGAWKKHHLDIQESQIKQYNQARSSRFLQGREDGHDCGSIDDEDFGLEPPNRHGILSIVEEDGNIKEEPYADRHPPTYKKFWKLLLEALDGKGAVPVEPESAARVIEIIEYALRSAEEKRTVMVARQGDLGH